MKKFAKLLAMVLAVSMVLTMFVGAYTDAADIDEDKADAVAAVYNYGIMMGNDKGEFNPQDNLTRDEMAKILFVLTNTLQDAGSVYGVLANEFDDAAAIPGWSKNFVGYAAAKNIIVGNDKNEVNALGNLSYVEAAIVLLRTLGLEAQYDYTVGKDEYDGFTGTKWFSNALFAADAAGLLADLDIEDFKAAITREDVAVMINNAIEYAKDKGLKDTDGNDLYKLAEDFHGVVIGEGKNAKKEATLVIDGISEEILLGDLDIDELLGKRIDAVVEAGKVVKYTVADSKTYEDVALGDVKYSNEDKDKGDKFVAGDEALKFGDEVVVANKTGYVYYMFENGTEGAPVGSALIDGADYQVATYIISEGVVSIFYAPIELKTIDAANIKEDYDDDDGWTGEFFVDTNKNNKWDDDELAIDGAYAKLEKADHFVTQIIDGELIVVAPLKDVDGSKLTVSKKGTDYTIKIDGEEAILATECAEDAAWFYANQGTNAVGTLRVYGNLIYSVKAAQGETDDFFYAIVKDWTEGRIVDADDLNKNNNKTEIIDVVTITLVTEDGEIEVQAPATAEALGIAEKTIYEVRESAPYFTPVELFSGFVTEKKGADMKVGDLSVDASKVEFVNLTGDGAELKDIEIDKNGVITVNGVKVKYETVKAYWIEVEVAGTGTQTATPENVYVVVYDADGEFGIYEEIFTKQAK